MGKPRGGPPPPKRNGGGGGGGGGGGESELHAAARSGDLQKVESIYNSNPLAVNSRDKHSRTPLHLAAWSGQTEVVNYLCMHKADIGAAAMDDTAAIHFASQKGHLEVVRTLLAAGVSVKAANRKGLTPLHYAVQGSYLELVKYLVRKGANLSAKTKAGQTPMDLANSEEVRSSLLDSEHSLKKEDKAAAGETDRKVDDSERTQPVQDTEMDPNATEEEFLDPNATEEETGARAKRKAEEGLSESKKARVSLQHLVAEDDAVDGEEVQ